MSSLSLLRDAFRHMDWADAIVWRAVLHSAAAEGEPTLKERLYHLHTVQRAYLLIWAGGALEFPEASSFADLPALAAWARSVHEDLDRFLETLGDGTPDRIVAIPWAAHLEERIGRTPHPSTLAETMLQVTTHSAYHRGQINTKLRELGEEPPLTDLIAWIWMGKPKAEWADR